MTKNLLPKGTTSDDWQAAGRTIVLSKKVGEPGTKHRMFQSNRITNAHYNYTLIQERLKTTAIFLLQDYISKVMNGSYVHQLDIFQDNTGFIKLQIPLRLIATPAQYGDVKKAAERMVSEVIRMRGKDLQNRDTIEFTGLFNSVIMTEERSGTITVTIRKDVAEMLISVDRSDAGRPKNYTSFLFEVCMNAKNKYTPRIYQYISSWKERGGVYVTLQQLRDLLQLGDKYSDYNLFKRRILIPCQEELKAMADCWFNVSDIEEEKQGKKVVGLRFKIVEITDDAKRQLLLHNLYTDYLPNYLHLTRTHIDNLSPIIEASNIYDVLDKVNELNLIIQERYREIPHKGVYCYVALINAFS